MTISKYQQMVREFDVAMNCARGWGIKGLRKSLILEEAKEIKDAVTVGDPIELLDGLCDLLYVTYGAAVAFDLVIPELYSETVAALVPGAGMEEISVSMPMFNEVVISVLDGIDQEDPNVVRAMTILVNGCWMMSAEGLGVELAPFFEEVHRTNMLKADGPIREDGKRLKPPGWKPPRIADMYAKRKGMPVPEDTP